MAWIYFEKYLRGKFGKHKGQKFSEVDKDYLKWCLENDIFDDDKYKWNSKIREYIKNLLVV